MRVKYFLYRVAVVIMACFVVFWCGRIYSVNRTQATRMYQYESDDTVRLDGLEIKLSDVRMYTWEKFTQEYECGSRTDYIGKAIAGGNGYLVCACLELKNVSSQDMSWDDAIDAITGGFEMTTWASSISPEIGKYMNVISSNSFKAGTTQDIWFATILSKVCFREKTWKNLEDEKLYYVMSLWPVKREIRLDLKGAGDR